MIYKKTADQMIQRYDVDGFFPDVPEPEGLYCLSDDVEELEARIRELETAKEDKQ